MDNRIKTNATISYMFLWWLFLLAKWNPNFNDDFTKKHSKNATKIHFIFLIIFICYNYFFSKYFYFEVPFILISLNKIINISIFSTLTLFILKWCYKASKGEDPKNISLDRTFKEKSSAFEINNLDESEKMIYLSSFLPFFWIISSKIHENKITSNWSKIWWILTFLMIIFYIFSGFNSIFVLLMFFYILVIVYYWVNIFINDIILFPKIIENAPNLQTAYLIFKSWIFYLFDFIKLIFWKQKKINFKDIFTRLNKKDQNYNDLLINNFTEEKLPIAKKIIFIPLLNLLFLPSLFVSKKSKYILAIFQWLIISFILVFIWIIYWFNSTIQLILLLPIFLWVANIDSNPFYRIPVIYEIYKIFDLLSFWVLFKVGSLMQEHKDIKEVKLKI